VRRWWRQVTQRQVVGDWVERGPVLDVGCNNGGLLVKLRDRGFEVSGIEMGEAGVRVCRERGLDVTHGNVEGVDLPNERFATVLLSHVLEHVRTPIEVLRRLRSALVPGGRIVIAVPNARGTCARLFAEHWHGWDPPFHLTHFDPQSLRAVLEKAGYEVTKVYTRGHPEDVTRSLAKLIGWPVTSLPLRAALLPPSWVLGKLALGGEICAVAHRAVHE
jgi:SAM-dependent methyltransferase